MINVHLGFLATFFLLCLTAILVTHNLAFEAIRSELFISGFTLSEAIGFRVV